MECCKRKPKEKRNLKLRRRFRKTAERKGIPSGHRIYRVYKGDLRTAVIRGGIALLGVALQIAVMLFLSLLVMKYSVALYLVLEGISVLFGIYIVYDSESYRYFWLVLILLLPVVGLFLYFMWGSRFVNIRSRNRLLHSIQAAHEQLPDGSKTLAALEETGHKQIACARYLTEEGLPVYENTAVRYYALGDRMREDLFSDLRSAKERIWLQYFIIFGGDIWNEIEEILTEKVKEGVDVRLLIDDVGCVKMINRKFCRRMAQKGIRLNIFSPIHRDLTKLALNYRNHQKILVIDRQIAYTGGINLSDEYFNIYPKYGHWKDTAVRLEGEGIQTLAAIFISMWNYTTDKRIDRISPEKELYEKPPASVSGNGFLQPFYCGPLKHRHNNADMVYQSLISHATRYVWITTPYLVLDRAMRETLLRMAKSGVDVRIYTPRHYDKWYVFQVTEANYGRLLREGVRIFEYVPGFIHAKNMLVDDECAICGSINLDYRSFYFHYEDAVIFYGGKTIFDIKEDFVRTEAVCEEITYRMWKERPWYRKALSWLLKFCSPLF